MQMKIQNKRQVAKWQQGVLLRAFGKLLSSSGVALFSSGTLLNFYLSVNKNVKIYFLSGTGNNNRNALKIA